MSYRTMKYIECDGCFRDTAHDDIVMEKEVELTGGKKLHLCVECVGMDRSICRECGEVHRDPFQDCRPIEDRIADGHYWGNR